MYGLETIDLGSYRGDDYFLAGFVEPEPTAGDAYDPDVDADEYGVSLARSTSFPLESNVEIVRLDTAHGQEPHLHLVYLPPGASGETKVYLEEGYTYERMKRYLLTNWKQFADRYIRHNE